MNISHQFQITSYLGDMGIFLARTFLCLRGPAVVSWDGTKAISCVGSGSVVSKKNSGEDLCAVCRASRLQVSWYEMDQRQIVRCNSIVCEWDAYLPPCDRSWAINFSSVSCSSSRRGALLNFNLLFCLLPSHSWLTLSGSFSVQFWKYKSSMKLCNETNTDNMWICFTSS